MAGRCQRDSIRTGDCDITAGQGASGMNAGATHVETDVLIIGSRGAGMEAGNEAAVSKTLRGGVTRSKGIRKAGDLVVVDLVQTGGEVTGAVAWHMSSGAPVTIAAKATIVATGGLTRLYRRNSASANMGGDGYALALRAGATLVDMEFVQFFPIGHLAPRLIGMDPIMWDPFRYKLGGKLLNGRMEEFTARYGSDEDGRYQLTRDLPTYAIVKEVEAGRGSPHGGAR